MTHQPAATYRLQLHAGFPFAAAQEVLPYFARLGISDLYLSPIWTAVPGSVHGYDVTDHSQIHPELGGQEGFERLAARARELGLSLLLDFVPNHMGIAGGFNPYWEDVLKHGPQSPYAKFFDIDWRAGKLLLPTLGEMYGQVLESGQRRLTYAQGAFRLRYYERLFPLTPASYAALLLEAASGLSGEAREEVTSLAYRAEQLSGAGENYGRESRLLERHLQRLAEQPDILSALQAAAERLDASELDALLRRQHYRLSDWRLALGAGRTLAAVGDSRHHRLRFSGAGGRPFYSAAP